MIIMDYDTADKDFICVDQNKKVVSRVFESSQGEIWRFDLCKDCLKKNCYQDFINEEALK